MVAVLQLLAIFLIRGNGYVLGEAYAFGVLWSFVLKSLGVLVLRFKRPGPANFGFLSTSDFIAQRFLSVWEPLPWLFLHRHHESYYETGGHYFRHQLLRVSIRGLYGLGRFTEKHSRLRPHGDQFQLTLQPDLSPAAVGCRPGGRSWLASATITRFGIWASSLGRQTWNEKTWSCCTFE